MSAYILRRLLLIIPTLFGILLINFALIQAAPGGPVEQAIAQMKGHDTGITGRMTQKDMQSSNNMDKYQGLPPELIAEIKALYGFDKPASERFFILLKNYLTFNFGDSYFRDMAVIDLIIEKMPVSISLGLWSTLLIYFISIPLGIKKALHHGSRFDIWSSAIVVVGYAIPGFMFAILLVVLFAGGTFFDFFPLRGLVSDNWQELSLLGKITDYFWHLCLPILAIVISGFAGLTMLTKNSFLEEIHKQYVITAYSKGISQAKVLYGHIFRNAMLIIVAGFPAAFIGILFSSSLLIEIIFSLDGLGLLGYEAILKRDYAVMFAIVYIFSLLGLVLKIISDLLYILIDPRINFESQQKL